MRFREPSGTASQLTLRLGRALSVCGAWFGRVLMLPVDIAFMLSDLFLVNLKKTRLFEEDCRGLYGGGGSPCWPAEKYTNRRLFNLVCRDVNLSDRRGAPMCVAGERARIYFVRGMLAGLLVVGIASGLVWTTARLWRTARSEAPPPEKTEKLVAERAKEATAAWARGDYKEALSLLQGAQRLAPENKELRYRIGLCFEKMGEPQKATAYFLDAAEGENGYPPALDKAALHFYEKADLGFAGYYAERAVELGQAEGPTYAILADRYVWAGDMQSAQRHLKTAMEKTQEDEIVRLVRAHSLLHMGELDEARLLLDNIPADTPCALLCGLYRLDLLWRIGRPDEAAEELKSVAERYPDVAWASLLLVDLQFAMGHRQEALDGAERLSQRFSRAPGVQLQLAHLLSRHGEDDRALEIALEWRNERTLVGPVNVLVGNIYLQRGRSRAARDHARRALRENPTDLGALLLAGRAALSMEDMAEAVERFEKAVEVASENAEARYLLGKVQRRAQKMGSALENLKKACELSTRSGEFHYEYGLALLETHEKKQAREEFLRAVELAPNLYDAYTKLGTLSQEDGDMREARRYYSTALRIAPARAVVAGNNLADMLLSANEDIPLALALAYSAHVNSLGGPLERHTADTLAQALIKAGYPARAVLVARTAAQAEPNDPRRHLRLGLAEAAAGNVEAAAAALERALELDPQSEQADTARGLLEKLRQRQGGRPE